MPKFVPPVSNTETDWESETTNQFLNIIRDWVNSPKFYAQTTDPGTVGVPNGTWAVWKNTTSGVVKLWVNDGGVMRSVTIT